MRAKRSFAVAAGVLLAGVSCASSGYMPSNDGRISTILEHGTPALVKDGKTYPGNPDGVAQAVAGNPAAEEYARKYSRARTIGFVEYLAGLGAMIGGGVMLYNPENEMGMRQPLSEARMAGGGVLFVGGLALTLVSAFQFIAAQAHGTDAINVYNDGVLPRLPRLPPPAPPTVAPPPLP